MSPIALASASWVARLQLDSGHTRTARPHLRRTRACGLAVGLNLRLVDERDRRPLLTARTSARDFRSQSSASPSRRWRMRASAAFCASSARWTVARMYAAARSPSTSAARMRARKPTRRFLAHKSQAQAVLRFHRWHMSSAAISQLANARNERRSRWIVRFMLDSV